MLLASTGNFGPLELVVVLFLLFVVLSLFRVPSMIGRRLRSRPCPRCGQRVPVGELECGACDFDFRTIGA
jgi:hypothetical protein